MPSRIAFKLSQEQLNVIQTDSLLDLKQTKEGQERPHVTADAAVAQLKEQPKADLHVLKTEESY